MNTPTPMTDKHINENMRVIGNAVVCNDFARQLERELAEAHKDRDEWQAIAEKLSEILESTLARFNAKKGQQ